MKRMRLVLIDEIQQVGEDRGATLEAIVSRMKITASHDIRFVAVSATCPNVNDVAGWLGCSQESTRCFGDEFRPVKLQTHVLCYPEGKNDFLFQQNLKYKLLDVVLKYYNSRPTLVFCGTRKDTTSSVQQILKDAISLGQVFTLNSERRALLIRNASKIADKILKDSVSRGVAFYHAGLSFGDRNIVQELFSNGNLMVVCTTSCLAKGVNLPAHLVVIQGTQLYNGGIYEELSIIDVLQMIGRAGRPQFDSSGVAVIMTTDLNRCRYENLVNGQEVIESELMSHIPTFLNTEIAIGSIRNIQQAHIWLLSTFLYRRIQANPDRYQVPSGLSNAKLDEFLKELLLFAIQDLKTAQMLKIKPDGSLLPLESGTCMARYSIAFETMKLFQVLDTDEVNLPQVILTLARASEFSQISLRRNEKSSLNALNAEVKFRLETPGKRKSKPKLIQTPEEKLFVLIQAVLGDLEIGDWSLKQEAAQVITNLQRIMKGALSYFSNKSRRAPLHNILWFNQSLHQKLWYDSPHVCRQVEKIGRKLSDTLAQAGVCSLLELAAQDPRVLEQTLSRNLPFGTKVQEAVSKIWPQFSLSFVPGSNGCLIVRAVAKTPIPRSKLGQGNYSTLLVWEEGESGLLSANSAVPNFSERPFEVSVTLGSKPVVAHLFNNEFIGMDVEATFSTLPVPDPPRTLISPLPPKLPFSAEIVLHDDDPFYYLDESPEIHLNPEPEIDSPEYDFPLSPSSEWKAPPALPGRYDSPSFVSKPTRPEEVKGAVWVELEEHKRMLEEERSLRVALEERVKSLERQFQAFSVPSAPHPRSQPCTPRIHPSLLQPPTIAPTPPTQVPLHPPTQVQVPLHPEGRGQSKWFSLAKQHAKPTNV